MFDQVKKLMEMNKQADQIKKELDAVTVEIKEASGIKMTVNGSQYVKTIEIDENYLKTVQKMKLESDLMRCFNSAVKKSQAVAAEKMKNVLPAGFLGS